MKQSFGWLALAGLCVLAGYLMGEPMAYWLASFPLSLAIWQPFFN